METGRPGRRVGEIVVALFLALVGLGVCASACVYGRGGLGVFAFVAGVVLTLLGIRVIAFPPKPRLELTAESEALARRRTILLRMVAAGVLLAGAGLFAWGWTWPPGGARVAAFVAGGVLAAIGLPVLLAPARLQRRWATDQSGLGIKRTLLPSLLGIGATVILSAYLYQRAVVADTEEREKLFAQLTAEGHAQFKPVDLCLQAEAARLTGKIAEAEALYGEALAELEGENRTAANAGFLPVCLRGLAAVRAEQGKTEEAERLYQRALEAARQVKDKRALAETREAYAKFLREQGREKEAVVVEAPK